MNIVKGVADLLRRASTEPSAESSAWVPAERFSSPSPRICFSEVGNEEILSILWKKHENAVDKVEKRKLFYVFLKQFLLVYNTWNPVHSGQLSEPATNYPPGSVDIVKGCSVGHPPEIILVLTQELAEITALVTELNTVNTDSAESTSYQSRTSLCLNIISEGLPVLDGLTIVTRSMHNCRVFGYYGGIQKLTALMKAAVVQLKAFNGAVVSDDNNLSDLNVEKTKLLQKILVYVVSVICSFVDLNPNVYERAQVYTNTVEFSLPSGDAYTTNPSSSGKDHVSATGLHWHQKAVVSVTEAGGLTWLVDLLRVIRRLSMKEQWIDMSLQYLTLCTLKSALSENPRAQNLFRSTGGLEVLLDGLGFPSIHAFVSHNMFGTNIDRNENPFWAIFQLQVLSLEVLRESVFGNLSNLQFLCESGRVHKFANSICWPTFMLQELQAQRMDSTRAALLFDNATNGSFLQCWNDYAVKLSRVLCSFLLAVEDLEFHSGQSSNVQSAVQVSSVYCELSIKWVMKVLVTVFPFIKACSNPNELPSHLRIFVNALQQNILYAFKKILVSLPALLRVFREEGIWDLIFSENFFYFGPSLEELPGEFGTCIAGVLRQSELCSTRNPPNNQLKFNEVKNLQIEIISFVEYVATISGNSHNLPECSIMLDSLEQSACHSDLAFVLSKGLHHILQLAVEQTVASFKTLNAVYRLLKVASVQAQELVRSGNLIPNDRSWLTCVEASLELFSEYLSIADDAKNLVLHNSACIDCLFDLFWEERLRKHALAHILDLMKLPPCSEEDQVEKLYLCSKYLETFTCIKEREKSYAELSIDLLVGVRNMVETDQMYYQALFRDGECFLHIVSLLNGNLDERSGELLVLNVLQTLKCLLSRNDVSKDAFRGLVGKGYQTMQSLLLEFCQSQPHEGLLNALLDMLVDGNFDIKVTPVIMNEDVIILFLTVLQKSSESLRHFGLNVFQQLLRDSISNRASCDRAGMLNFLLDWFGQEDNDEVILQIGQLIQVIGGHSISGKDIRKIFALLRDGKIGSRGQHCSLLLTCVLSMFHEKGPTAFFDLNGHDSGIVIKTPLQWPQNKGFSFSCWVRVENFPRTGTMGLFNFLTENGRGCFALLGKDKIVYESFNQKRQSIMLQLNLIRKKWHFLCITHSIGRAFSGGSLLRCYVDGNLVSSEKCRYSKVTEALTHCTIGTTTNPVIHEEENALSSMKDSSPFLGQIGPIYLFGDAISSEQIQGIYSLGPSYMYSFVDNDVALASDNLVPNGILDAKDGLASKLIFGLNAQAGEGKNLFNVAPVLDHAADKISFEAFVLSGTQLCSRRLLQEIIYCVGGVSVFFPLLTQFDRSENPESGEIGELGDTLLRCVVKDYLAAEVIELIASVLDKNLANQQQMNHISGFQILGFLLQSVPPQKVNLETLSALKHLFNVVANCGLSEVLVEVAISRIFLNPFIWVYTVYKVQRELYMFLIQQFDNDPRLLSSLCCLPHVIDVISQFYWDKPKPLSGYGSMTLLYSLSKDVTGPGPSQEDTRKIRLLLLSLGEMSLRQNISTSDIKALIAFFERSQDMTCIEDVLHMVTRAVSQKPLLASFLEQVNLLGGCHIFVNLLERDFEPVRLLSLQFVGRLLVGLPSEKKGPRFFNLAVGRLKSLSEGHRKIDIRMQPIFSAISDRLFKFPQTDLLCATLFDVLLGGASPKQVLQKQNQPEKQRVKGNNSHFLLPQMLVLIFRFLSYCDDASARVKILSDLLDLLDSNHSNLEALMEHGWNSWLATCVRLDVVKNYKLDSGIRVEINRNEQNLVRNLFCVVLSYYMQSVKGGWHQLEETVNFLLFQFEQGEHVCQKLLNDIFEDLIASLADLSSQESIFVLQPCRDNTLYLLKLIDEMFIFKMEDKLPYPASGSDLSIDCFEVESKPERDTIFVETSDEDNSEQPRRNQGAYKKPVINEDEVMDDKRWSFYEKLWVIIGEMNGKGPSKMLPKSSSSVGPSFGQRARGLVESLNIPAAEMAAVVVSGGIGNALGGKTNKTIDKAMILRGEKCPRLVFRLVILYLCKSCLERASRCVQQVLALLPCLLAAEDEQSKSRLQFFIWSLLNVRLQYGTLDDGARYHVISHLIRETVNWGKPMLATSIISKDDSSDFINIAMEVGTIQTLIQKDRVLAAVADEAKYMKTSKFDRTKQLQDLRLRMDVNSSAESYHRKTFEYETQSALSTIVSSDYNRRIAFQLAHDEDQEIVAEKWVHMFRTLIDERGPWSANPFQNNIITHWKLDKTEDSRRRRPKMKRNYRFDKKLCHPPPTTLNKETSPDVTGAKSGLGSHIPEQMKLLLLKGIRKITDARTSESENDLEPSMGKDYDDPDDSANNQHLEHTKDGRGEKDNVSDRKESSSTASEAESSEVLMSTPCVLVTPKRKVVGHLAVMKNVLHFFGEFLVEGAGGSSVFKNFNAPNNSGSAKTDQLRGVRKQKVPKWSVNMNAAYEKGQSMETPVTVNRSLLQKETKIKRHRRWNVCKIKSVHWTRYLLRYTAIEIFFCDSVAPVFFNFPSQKVVKDVGTLIVSSRNESLFPKVSSRDRSGTISFVDRRVALEMAEIAQESWRRRDMTNFEYLMILNTLAGRSYNDLTQYPVFPWILADYSSEKLNFNTSSTFRDLSKPVGALNSKRFEVFEDRYRNFCDPDIPSFYYGSHYSSMGIVLFYLLRLEPFTALHRGLQGGKLDHADRLFQSIEGTYRNCLSNTSDVKELIPEFFYMPEFLVNSNSYHLGVKQDGEPLRDVCLPPWAKGSPEEFINRNREALESEYVSSNLHHWIDLVFGFKQRGKPAVEAANIFYYLTYEGAVELDAMEDELQRSAIEDQIANFGQTPIQIFRKKHSRRGPPIPIAHPLYFAPGSINLTSIISYTAHPPAAVLYIGIFDSTVVLVNQGLTMSVKMWLTTQLQSGGNFTFSGSQDPFFGVGSDVFSSRNIGSPLAENIEIGSQYFAKMQTPSESFLISCGNWENSFQIISLSDGRTVQTIRQHKDVVSCVAVTSDGSIIATGSYDTTVMVWEVCRVRPTEKKIRNAQTELLRKDYVISGTPFHILCGHDDIITCVFVSIELDIVISGSKDGTCIFHTLREGSYIRSLQHPSSSALSKLVASQHGRVVLYAEDDLSLHMYSINGKHIATSESNGRLNCVELSSCGEFLVCAGDQGQIVVRSMNSLEVVRRYNGVGKIITSLTVTPEECFLAGTKDGSLLVYSIEHPQLRKTGLPWNVKSKASPT